MKPVFVWAILLLATAHTVASSRTVGAGAGGAHSANAVAQTPITRVVKLLQGLALKTEMEGKREEDLYYKFVCWAETIINSKTSSNSAASARVETLKGYIEDIDAGRYEFTTERKDLEYELKTLKEDKESAESQRSEENSQFVAAEAEMEQAIAALDKAITVLRVATENAKNGTFLVQRHRELIGEGFTASLQDATDLAHAVELGQKALSAGDALFLQRLLTAEVPKHDWKKLNRKATFKMSYKARSFKIQGVLQKLNETFTANLADARAKEAEAQANFDKLVAAKEAQIEETQQALEKLVEETGVKEKTKQESQDEVDALEEQIANDLRFINQTKMALATKKGEWKERYTLRAAEVAAMREAASILYSDDARDLAKRSFKSQGYSLLQESDKRQASQRFAKAAAVLKEAAHTSSDSRLSALASRVAAHSGYAFPAVIEAIDKMVANLKVEEEDDLKKKEDCEENRAKDTREAAKASREMDDSTELIMRLETEIAELAAAIKEKKAVIKTTEDELAEATKVRKAEHQEYTIARKDDNDMYATVQKAKEVLQVFYQQNNLMFAQESKVPAGEAPPPPPTTWEGPYMGKTQQTTGVIATLDIISEDIQKDIDCADAAEKKAAEEYNTFKSESESSLKELATDVDELAGTKSDKEEEASAEASERRTKKGSLAAVLKSISDANPGCEYFTVNYPRRLRNRQIEIDGLLKAKTVLQGGKFDEGPDPNREMKPGDAFLQHKH